MISASTCGFYLPQIVPSHYVCIYLWIYILFYELKCNIINSYLLLKWYQLQPLVASGEWPACFLNKFPSFKTCLVF